MCNHGVAAAAHVEMGPARCVSPILLEVPPSVTDLAFEYARSLSCHALAPSTTFRSPPKSARPYVRVQLTRNVPSPRHHRKKAAHNKRTYVPQQKAAHPMHLSHRLCAGKLHPHTSEM